METTVKYREKQKDLARSREGNGHYCIISSGRGGFCKEWKGTWKLLYSIYVLGFRAGESWGIHKHFTHRDNREIFYGSSGLEIHVYLLSTSDPPRRNIECLEKDSATIP